MLGLVAVNTANNLLYLVESGLLGIFVISGFFGHRNICRLQITLQPPEEIFAATEYPLHITVSNTRRFMPAFLLRVRIAGKTLLLPYLEPRGRRIAVLPFSFARRGAAVIEGLAVGSLFPFSFVRQERNMDDKIPVIVFPCPLDRNVKTSNAAYRRSAGEQQALRPWQETEVLSVRDYRAGDTLRHIHWKASARTGKLKTKEMATAVDEPVVIDFDEMAGADQEKKLSAAAFLILSLLKRNSQVGLMIAGKLYPPGSSRMHRIAMLTGLALYDTEKTSHQN